MSKGILIEFEGLDCSFKETNSKALVDYISKKTNRKCILIDYPRYNNQSSYFVRQYLAGKYDPDPSNVDPDIASIAYAMDRYHDWMVNIKPIYDEGGIIVADRYTISNMIFQCAKVDSPQRAGLIGRIIKLENRIMRLPKPDIVLLMNQPYEVAVELMAEKASKDDIHEENNTYMRLVHYNYDHIRKLMSENRIYTDCVSKVIDCSKDGLVRNKEDIFKDITDFVDIELKRLLKGEYENV